jgi:anti-sigma factor RsiW
MRADECSQIEENLVEFVEQTAPAALRKEMQAHLAACSRCGRLVKDFSELWGELSPQARKDPPASFRPSLERAARALEEHPIRSSAFVSGLLGLLRPAAVSLAVLLAVLAGFQLGGLQERYLPDAQLSGLPPELKQEAYAARYLEPFTDIPEGSLADFYLGNEPSEVDKTR